MIQEGTDDIDIEDGCPPKTDMTMEKTSFEDVSPMKRVACPLPC